MKLFNKNCSLIKDNDTIEYLSKDKFDKDLLDNKIIISPKPISEGNYGYIHILYDKKTEKDVLYILKSQKNISINETIISVKGNFYLLKITKMKPIPPGLLEKYLDYILGEKLPNETIEVYSNVISTTILSKNIVLNDFTSFGLSLNKGDYFVSEPFVHEYLLMCETSKFLTDSKTYCLHFTDIYNLIKVEDEYKMIMEYICCGTLQLTGNTHLWEEFYSPELFLSIFFAIATYQTKGICHYDLHLANILYIIVNEKYDPRWKGKRLLDYDYFEYSIKGVSFYIKRPKIIIKIADWGLGMKYDNPKIVYSNFSLIESLDRSKYSSIYDVARIILSVNQNFDFHSVETEFINDVTEIIFKGPPSLDSPVVILKELTNTNITAEDMILKYGLFDHLKNHPSEKANIIKVGNI